MPGIAAKEKQSYVNKQASPLQVDALLVCMHANLYACTRIARLARTALDLNASFGRSCLGRCAPLPQSCTYSSVAKVCTGVDLMLAEQHKCLDARKGKWWGRHEACASTICL